MMFSELHIGTLAQLRRLCVILKTAKISNPPHKVHINPDRYSQPEDHKLPIPSLALALSSLGLHLRQTSNILCNYCDSYLPDIFAIREAPPRIEAAVSALLRPLQHLTHLHLGDMKFRSVTQLLGIIRAQPHIQHIYLEWIEVLQATERFYWPPNLALTSLQHFKLDHCTVPANTIPIFVSLMLGGKPNFTPSPPGVPQHYSQQPGHSHSSRRIHHDDQNVLVEIAQVLGQHLCSRHNHSDGAAVCKFEISAATDLFKSGKWFLMLGGEVY
ncbi:uncharacterized protein PHACADRAFT_257408 [Phanerochaete carnosa HHB-10118-sp]|uniref:F-box domain-containing protein n=1 Tax=Phanerochaete carnosa (strain HHB-10118-sp) TaxID=650164 RepID=K5WU07_PHACS|nr:uncharacterized protein PHACADRAFT_257408 [Phanerochaete carnosa HHB-10118-sp]EKM53912.1 hypothetical protein PHACADRAFT_257408 [Phanerochaete carnosa HHB-10118-sp]